MHCDSLPNNISTDILPKTRMSTTTREEKMTNNENLELLNDPVAQELLRAPIPAHLAYNWKDGTPRVIPIAFYWTGEEIVMCSPDAAPKNHVIDNEKVSIAIDTPNFPFKVLTIRGTAKVTISESVPNEYVKASQQLLGLEGAQAWFKTLEPMLPKIQYFTRIAVKPEWVGLMDFQTRFPSAIVKAMG
jgi:hypothetical protein